MKAKIDDLPYLTPEQGKALFNFFVDVIEAQRERAGLPMLGGQAWGTVGQIAKFLDMSTSGARSLLERIVSAGSRLRQTNPNAIPGRPMHVRYYIEDVQAGLYLLKSINHITKTLTRKKGVAK